MQESKPFDCLIREALSERANQVNAPDPLKVRIHNELFYENNKEPHMKRVFSIKNVACIAAIICCLVTVTVFASGTFDHYVSKSSGNSVYTEMPSVETLQKDIGFAPKLIGSFSNGYSFKEASIYETAGASASNENLFQFKQLDADYASADGQLVSISSSKTGSFVVNQTNYDQISSYKNIDLNYDMQVYRFVPEGYQLTDADKEAQANGSVVFSYGSTEEETETIQFVNWTDCGIDYNLRSSNTALTASDLFTMAQELIDKN